MRALVLSITIFASLVFPACSQFKEGSYPQTNNSSPSSASSTASNSARSSQNRIQHSSPLSMAKALPMPRGPAPKPGCAAVCVIDPKTGHILYEHNGYTRRQVASTQKIMTALCVVDAGRMNDLVTIKREDVRVPRIRMDLRPGDKYTRLDLLRAMMTSSYNDVAAALARDTSGSVEDFMDIVNARARRMGMNDSYFANPHGLPAEQYSTARDMAIAACWAYSNPVIRSCTNIPEYHFVRNDGTTKRVRSTNRLLKTSPWINGLKTGYTNLAGRCFISSGTIDGYSVIVVILGSTTRKIWAESLKYHRWALPMSSRYE